MLNPALIYVPGAPEPIPIIGKGLKLPLQAFNMDKP
jgi:hypothetical protein